MTSAATGGLAQRLRVVSELESTIDTALRRDSSVLEIGLNWSRLSGGAGERISGLVTSVRLGTHDSLLATPTGILVPFPFSATRGSTGGAELSTPDAGSCASSAAFLAPLREALIFPPKRLTPGLLWTDSSTVTVCRDSIPLTVATQRQYRVLGADAEGSEVVVLLERQTRVQMQGSGTQFGEPVEIRAEGEGSTSLTLRLAGAYILRANGSQELRMTMRGRRRTQELRQRSRIEIIQPDSAATP
ncbi:MAG: hypothetical protein ACKVS7_15055 [Gemmatimonadaceae bacterium]